MPQTLRINLKPSLFHKEQPLIIEPGFMEFGTINLSKLEIAAIRYGFKGIKGYGFWIGRIYCIDVKGVDESIIKLRFTSLLRIGLKKINEKFTLVFDTLFDNYINDIFRDYADQFDKGVDVDLPGISFTKAGIMPAKTKRLIYWRDVGTKKYWQYFAVFSKTDLTNNALFYYLADWNTAVIMMLLEHILKTRHQG